MSFVALLLVLAEPIKTIALRRRCHHSRTLLHEFIPVVDCHEHLLKSVTRTANIHIYNSIWFRASNPVYLKVANNRSQVSPMVPLGIKRTNRSSTFSRPLILSRNWRFTDNEPIPSSSEIVHS